VYFDSNMEDPAVTAAVGREKYSVRGRHAHAAGDRRVQPQLPRWFRFRTAQSKVLLDGKELDFNAPPPGPSAPAPGRSRQDSGGPGRQAAAHGRTEILAAGGYRQSGSGGAARLAWVPPASALLAEAEKVVKDSDVAIVCVGLSSELEGEEMRWLNVPGFAGGDRTSLDLPERRRTW